MRRKMVMDDINALLDDLATNRGFIIEVSPGQVPLLDAAVWGPEKPVEGPPGPPPKPFSRYGFDIETRDWRTTILFLFPGTEVPILIGIPPHWIPVPIKIPRGRVRTDTSTLIAQYKPETVPYLAYKVLGGIIIPE